MIAATRPSRRLWKCRRRGNHRPVSTAAWKSRTDARFPHFHKPIPGPLITTNGKNTTAGAPLDKRRGVRAR